MVARSGSVADPRWSPTGSRLAWIEAHDGRADLVVVATDGSGPPVVVTADVGVGGGYAWATDDELVVAGADGRLVVVRAGGGVVRVLASDGRAAAPTVSSRGEVAFVLERDDACDIAIVPIAGSAWPERVSYADYAWDPAWSPDGTQLVWHEWDLPNMPWDGSRIIGRGPDGAMKVVAGGEAIAVGQPRFAPDGRRLAYVSDAAGWSTIWTADTDGGNRSRYCASRENMPSLRGRPDSARTRGHPTANRSRGVATRTVSGGS